MGLNKRDGFIDLEAFIGNQNFEDFKIPYIY
jgi:hypothetical protein